MGIDELTYEWIERFVEKTKNKNSLQHFRSGDKFI